MGDLAVLRTIAADLTLDTCNPRFLVPGLIGV